MTGLKQFFIKSLILSAGVSLAVLSLPLVLGAGVMVLAMAIAARLYLAWRGISIRPGASYQAFYHAPPEASSCPVGGRPDFPRDHVVR